MKKKEILMIAILFLVSVAFIVGKNFIHKDDGVKVVIKHQDKVVERFDPSVDAIYHIQGSYGTLDVEVKDGKWHVTNEQCPNHICAKMGWVGIDDSIPIVCLPNEVIVQVEEK